MKSKLLFLGLTIILLSSCCKEKNYLGSGEYEYFAFGHFFGECGGENCVVRYVITGNQLLEDTDDSDKTEKFVKLDQELYYQVKDLEDKIPQEMFDSPQNVYGCPDCADGGGLLIDYRKKGKTRKWALDYTKHELPVQIGKFVDAIHEKIYLINK